MTRRPTGVELGSCPERSRNVLAPWAAPEISRKDSASVCLSVNNKRKN
jgi:hypothetical protein